MVLSTLGISRSAVMAFAFIAALVLLPRAYAQDAVMGNTGGKVLATVRESTRRDAKKWFKPGDGQKESFRDCIDDACRNSPEMVIVPAGEFTKGAPESEPGRWAFSEQQQKITIRRPFAVGKYAVTRDEFQAFVTATRHEMATQNNCEHPDGHTPGASWLAPGFPQTGDHPVVCVKWDDAKAYAAWLSKKTGKHYRLLIDTEREYVTRAGTTTPFWWGTTITPDDANYNSRYAYEQGPTGEPRGATLPVNAFRPNPWGLYQVHGNVQEWVEDCWDNLTLLAPPDGSVRPTASCIFLMSRGGSWDSLPGHLRAAFLGLPRLDARRSDIGFRVARDL